MHDCIPALLVSRITVSMYLDCSQSPIFSLDRREMALLNVNGRHLDFQMYRGSGRWGLLLWGKRARKIEGLLTSLQLAFTERVVPATQAVDWSLDNRC